MNILLDVLKINFIPCALNAITVIYIISKILNVKIDFKSPRVYIIFFIMIIIATLNFVYTDSYIRFLVSTICTMIFAKLIFKEKFPNAVAATVLEQVILFLSELIYALIIIVIFKFDNITIFETVFGSLIPNLLICLIAIIIINIKPIFNICNKIMHFMDKIETKSKYCLVLLFIVTLNILLMLIYINSLDKIIVLVNVIFILVYSYIVYLLLNEKNENVKFKEENQTLLGHLNEYEKMLDYQRVSNHENKNQLLVIKTMASKNNTRLLNYLDEIIQEKRADDEILYTRAKNIPSGGLQGLVYQKMLLMKENYINVDLNVSREVRKIDLLKINSKTNYDVCRVMGVLIDNAVDEVKKLKDKEVSISMYRDESYFIIEVANKCKEVPDLQIIDNKGYTTKESGHGYGLSLLKEICDNNENIINERKIVNEIFIQIIKVKLQ